MTVGLHRRGFVEVLRQIVEVLPELRVTAADAPALDNPLKRRPILGALHGLDERRRQLAGKGPDHHLCRRCALPFGGPAAHQAAEDPIAHTRQRRLQHPAAQRPQRARAGQLQGLREQRPSRLARVAGPTAGGVRHGLPRPRPGPPGKGGSEHIGLTFSRAEQTDIRIRQ